MGLTYLDYEYPDYDDYDDLIKKEAALKDDDELPDMKESITFNGKPINYKDWQ